MLIRFTELGEKLRAVANDSSLARIHGIKVDSVILTAFALGSVLVGLASILHARDTGMTPTMGLNAMIGGAVAMILGGVGNHFWHSRWRCNTRHHTAIGGLELWQPVAGYNCVPSINCVSRFETPRIVRKVFKKAAS